MAIRLRSILPSIGGFAKTVLNIQPGGPEDRDRRIGRGRIRAGIWCACHRRALFVSSRPGRQDREDGGCHESSPHSRQSDQAFRRRRHAKDPVSTQVHFICSRTAHASVIPRSFFSAGTAPNCFARVDMGSWTFPGPPQVGARRNAGSTSIPHGTLCFPRWATPSLTINTSTRGKVFFDSARLSVVGGRIPCAGYASDATMLKPDVTSCVGVATPSAPAARRAAGR
jgi:hypothetical protein